MNRLILVAHGELAQETKKSVEMIFGNVENVNTVDFYKEEGLQSVEEKLIDVMEPNMNYLIFCDLYGGTPYNASCSVALKHPEQNIEVLSGMSLALVLEAVGMIEVMDIQSLSEVLIKTSQQIVMKFDKKILEDEEEL